MHMAHGDQWTDRLSKDPKTHDELQASFDRWYPRTMNIFGRAHSPKNAIYRKYGLKKRDNDDVRKAFAADIKVKSDKFGLRVPAWAPVASKMSEEPFIPG